MHNGCAGSHFCMVLSTSLPECKEDLIGPLYFLRMSAPQLQRCATLLRARGFIAAYNHLLDSRSDLHKSRSFLFCASVIVRIDPWIVRLWNFGQRSLSSHTTSSGNSEVYGPFKDDSIGYSPRAGCGNPGKSVRPPTFSPIHSFEVGGCADLFVQ